MIILIGGASHTGKTLLAQKLLEKYRYPYLSIDYLKMGLIRSGNTDLTVEDDDKLTDYLWPIVREMVKTAIENKQNLIVEGCYIPFDWKKDFDEEYLTQIRYCCLIMSRRYIETHFADIKNHASVIEERLDDTGLNAEDLIRENEKNLAACRKHGCEYILIDDTYKVDLCDIGGQEQGMKLRNYVESDCAVLTQLFYDTVHSVNTQDYTQEQLDAWATGDVDLDAWNASFLAHRTVVAEIGGKVVGFGDMDERGYLDRLYVHKDYQRCGVAAAICDELENSSTATECITHASITARPFFEKRGYAVVKEQQVERRGVCITNYVMRRSVSAKERRLQGCGIQAVSSVGAAVL